MSSNDEERVDWMPRNKLEEEVTALRAKVKLLQEAIRLCAGRCVDELAAKK